MVWLIVVFVSRLFGFRILFVLFGFLLAGGCRVCLDCWLFGFGVV